MPRRILVVEDDRDIAQLIEMHLRDVDCDVTLAHDGAAGFDLATRREFDVIILDLNLPKLDGLEITRRLRGRTSYTPILMLTARSADVDRIVGLEIGADDYLTKPFAVAELLARVRALIRRRIGKGDPVLRFSDIELDRHRRKVSRSRKPITLTAKEFALLEFLLARAPEVVSRSEIVEHVWDANFDSETNLVEVYIN